ncbi:hypothetical protein NLU13_1899 [Sarocladium strictum]|uniref:Uncharacterized protein n=1 Tax=Sarocladium strictum TaxID=5046 RepID=A0AA39LCY2_SARSR|nr:hypothetical protein NLU13_1899 [Sarocladium strictum]
MARTKDDVQKAAAAATAASDDTPKRRGRPAKAVTDADTGAGVKKTPGKRGRPAGATPKPKPKPATAAAAADGTAKRRGRPPGSTNKTKGSSSTTKKLRDFLPALPAEEKTNGADRRRAKMEGKKLEMLPDVKRAVNPNDGRRKNKGVPKGATPKKTATSPLKRDSPAVASSDDKSEVGKENASQTPLFGGFKSMFG